MDIVAFYASHPYWVWLAIGAVILAVEAGANTEWLLWPAVCAAVVAVLTAIGLRFGFPIDLAVFSLLTIGTTLASRKLTKRVNPPDADINDRNVRLVGLQAQVTSPFENGRGRVFVSGSEWPADIEGPAPPVGDKVVVMGFQGTRLTVRAIETPPAP
ncbi:MAG: NfeD family protein [Brevundimonas sp.]|jgi:inner membrane protein|uniref:NfeD family protein n=1 Tax=Brevundimonas sp. TaxID=1871086 RepID=UPI00391A7B55